MGRFAVKSFEKPTKTKSKGRKDIIPKIDTKKGHNKVTDKENLMALAKKLIINHPELTLEQAFQIEMKRQAARKKREEEVTIDASIHLRIDQEMEEFMMEESEDEREKENCVYPSEDYQIGISVKLNQMDLSKGEGRRDKNNEL